MEAQRPEEHTSVVPGKAHAHWPEEHTSTVPGKAHAHWPEEHTSAIPWKAHTQWPEEHTNAIPEQAQWPEEHANATQWDAHAEWPVGQEEYTPDVARRDEENMTTIAYAKGSQSLRPVPAPLSKANWLAKAHRAALPRPIPMPKLPEPPQPSEALVNNSNEVFAPESLPNASALEVTAVKIVQKELVALGGKEALSSLSVRVKWGQNDLAQLGPFRKFLSKFTEIFKLENNVVHLAHPPARHSFLE